MHNYEFLLRSKSISEKTQLKISSTQVLLQALICSLRYSAKACCNMLRSLFDVAFVKESIELVYATL